MRSSLTWLVLLLVVGGLRAAESVPLIPGQGDAHAAAWLALGERVWPETSVHEDAFGPAQDGLRIAARPMLMVMPHGDRVPVAVMVENVSDRPIALHGFNWSVTLRSANHRRHSVTRAIGLEADPATTVILAPGQRAVTVQLARVDQHALADEALVVALNLPTPPGLSGPPGARVYANASDLISAPFRMTWQDGPSEALAEVLDLLHRSAYGDREAWPLLANRFDIVTGFAYMLAVDRKTASRLVGQLRWHPELGADDILILNAIRYGPWGRYPTALNGFAWELAEHGHCTGSKQREALAVAAGAMAEQLGRGTGDAHATADTFAAVLASVGRFDEAIAMQRHAYALVPNDRAQQADIGGRIVDFIALSLMPEATRPALFTTEGFISPEAQAALRRLAEDSDAMIAARAQRLLRDSSAAPAAEVDASIPDF